MEPAEAEVNGHKDVRTLAPMRLGSGPEWRMPAELAARFIAAVYDRHPDIAGRVMHLALTGAELSAKRARRGGPDA
jgi:hypothetical protein